MIFQHVGQKIERLPCGGIQISNLKIIQNFLAENKMMNGNSR